ncbi:MAG: hypothetical protein WC549_09670 [Actinomycetota bacterium]
MRTGHWHEGVAEGVVLKHKSVVELTECIECKFCKEVEDNYYKCNKKRENFRYGCRVRKCPYNPRRKEDEGDVLDVIAFEKIY